MMEKFRKVFRSLSLPKEAQAQVSQNSITNFGFLLSPHAAKRAKAALHYFWFRSGEFEYKD